MKTACIIALVFALGVAIGSHRGGSAASTQIIASAQNVSHCTEDMSCWDCHTMGNRICGVTVDHACIPFDSGGGVTLCRQPNAYDLALQSCLKNPGRYIGANIEDTLRLLAQCVNDQRDRKGWS